MKNNALVAAVFACTLVTGLIVATPALAASSEGEAYGASQTRTVKLVAVGDDLLHTSVYQSCKTSHGYDFDPIFVHVKDETQGSDIAVINQETILVNGHYSGYPAFGSPKSVGKAIAKAGFNVVTSATNHAMDRGSSAILGTCAYWRHKHPSVTLLGIHSSKKDAAKIRVVKKNGIRIAMLNYTYGLNGIPLPRGKGYLVDLLASSRKAMISKQIKRAKKKSDFVIVFAHWGTEYRHSPDSSQRSWAKFFANRGVDLVVGGHPHVVEPLKTVKGKNGHKMRCFYSLGNFVSAQRQPACLLGGMAKVTIVKKGKARATVKACKMEGLVTHIGRKARSFTVYPLSQYTRKLAKKNWIHHWSSGTFTAASLKRLFKRVS